MRKMLLPCLSHGSGDSQGKNITLIIISWLNKVLLTC